jgi:hypothetical protein
MHLIERGFLQTDATKLNSPILAKDIKNSMTTIHTYCTGTGTGTQFSVFRGNQIALVSLFERHSSLSCIHAITRRDVGIGWTKPVLSSVQTVGT